MNGLMPEPKAQPQPPQAAPGSEPMPAQPDAGGEAVTPQEQALYQRFVANGLTIAYSEEMADDVLAMLQSGEPKQALATTASTVVMLTAKQASEKGVELSPEIIMQGGAEIFESLAEYATKAGIHDFGSDDEAFEGAWLLAVDEARLMLQQEGAIDQEAAAQELQEFEQMGMEV